jgi:hypothetical protein
VTLAGGNFSGLGHVAIVVLFRNTGNATCRIGGYPGVDGVLSDGQQVPATRSLNGYAGGVLSGTAPIFELAPSQEASSMVEGLNVSHSGAPCPHFNAFLVTPPGSTATSRLVPPNGLFNYCQGIESVHPVVAGTNGRQGQ